MKTLQTIQKRPYTPPFVEVLKAENDMPLLANSQLQREDMQQVSTPNSEEGGLLDEEI